MKKLFFLPLAILLLPIQVSERHAEANVTVAGSESKQLNALSEYLAQIKNRGHSPDDQGVIVETLDHTQALAEHNADLTFNPASVMKLATSLVALAKFGPDYRYRTNFLADGSIDQTTHTLDGDLVVEANADPVFSLYDAQDVATQLSQLGIARVKGTLRITGPFYYFANGYHSNLSPETSAGKLRAALGQRIKIEGETTFGEKSGKVLLSHYSDPLAEILLFQNAHSSNAIAEVVGVSLGGPQAIQDYLIKKFDLSESEIFVGRASGLDFNRITPRATLKILLALVEVLKDHSLKPEDVMAVAGIDSGTLRTRLAAIDVRASVVAKTGTLVSIDNGVSTLVGLAYTKDRGPLLFAVFNSGGNVNAYRKLQDQFIQRVIAEEGGAVPAARTEDALADVTRHSFVQVLYRPGGQSSETAAD